jgi:WD40 repeat protein
LAVGDGSGKVAIWDVTKSKQLRVMSGHSDRVPVLGWNEHILASGCRDGQVQHIKTNFINCFITTDTLNIFETEEVFIAINWHLY